LTWYLRNENSAGAPDAGQFQYGVAGWKPVAGDWDGDGVSTPAVVDPAANWYVRNENSAGAPDLTFPFGVGTWTPLAGRWTTPAQRPLAAVGHRAGWPDSDPNSGLMADAPAPGTRVTDALDQVFAPGAL
jgi:hypothetical protein